MSTRNPGNPPYRAMLSLTLPAEPEAACTARRRVRELPLDSETQETVALLVTELLTNAMRHAPTPVPPGTTIDLQVTTDEHSVRVEVVNEGPGFNWRRRAKEPTQPGGLGLVLVDRLADRWGIVGGEETRVWLELEH